MPVKEKHPYRHRAQLSNIRNFPQSSQGQPGPTQKRSGLGVKVLTLDKASLGNSPTPSPTQERLCPTAVPQAAQTLKSYPQQQPTGERKA